MTDRIATTQAASAQSVSNGGKVTGGTCQGVLFILVGPTAVGKNTLMEQALLNVPNLRQMPTATTRSPRTNETHGKQHYFISVEDFRKLITENALLEYQEVHTGRFYGTLRGEIEKAFQQAHEMLIADIDVLGAMNLKRILGKDAILIFIAPPSMEELERRLRERAIIEKTSENEMTERLNRARMEMTYLDKCDHCVVNRDLPQAVDELVTIIREYAVERGCL